MNKGRFITFEGGEGCGKSTQVQRLKIALERNGKSVLITREPGGTRLSELIRILLKDETDDPPCDRSELLLFLAARAQLVKNVIRPALDSGKWVVSDRFSDSTFAYQGYGRELPLDFLKMANAFACEGLVPDKTFLLEADLETAFSRMHRRETATNTKSDRIELEGKEFHLRLMKGFVFLANENKERIVRVDASGTPDEVESLVWKSLKPLI